MGLENEWYGLLCLALVWFPILSFLMGNMLVISNLVVVFAKVILCRLTFSLCVPWDYKVCCIKHKWRGISGEWVFVEMDQKSHIYFLQMIVCYFAVLKKKSAKRFLISHQSMRGVQARKLIVRRLIHFLALTFLMRFRFRFNRFLVSLLFAILKSIWVCRHWWVEQKNRVSSTLKKGCGKSFKG